MTTTTFETIFVTQTFIPPTSTISHVIKTSNPNETRRAIKKETVSFSRTFLSVVLLLNTNILLVINDGCYNNIPMQNIIKQSTNSDI